MSTIPGVPDIPTGSQFGSGGNPAAYNPGGQFAGGIPNQFGNMPVQNHNQQYNQFGNPVVPSAPVNPAGAPVVDIPASTPLAPNGAAYQQHNQFTQPAQHVSNPWLGQGVPGVAPTAPAAPAVPENNAPAFTPATVDPSSDFLAQSVGHLANELKVNPELFHKAIEGALQYGNADLVNTGVLGNLTPEQTQRVRALAGAMVQQEQTRSAQAQASAHAAAGGEAQWNAAINAFRTNANPEAQNYAMYLADNVSVDKAIEFILNTTRNSGMVQFGNAPLQGGNGSAVNGLNKEGYIGEIRKLELSRLDNKIHISEYNRQMADLDNRRRIGIAAGLQ